MKILKVQTELSKIFTENGFEAWAEVAKVETCPNQLTRLAIRAVNTTPKEKRISIENQLIKLLKHG